MRKKSERVLILLEKGPLLKEERQRARKVARGIEGFGSFNHRWSSEQDGAGKEPDLFRKCNSHYEADSERRDGVEDVKESCQNESEPLIAPGKDEQKIELRNGDHPFSKMEHPKIESALLLGQS